MLSMITSATRYAAERFDIVAIGPEDSDAARALLHAKLQG